ncbi:hypothetical protein SAMN05421760_105246 [Neptunomonas antarctica]|uniref:Uncharacterized protein n=1 Tax=Neptunomonas antarctica TaxID=619304 RepID=A0A1N7M7U7_9GAMM|nr:hypothetical protein SAMN05421760_105246 [Neptunomonas antarctica]
MNDFSASAPYKRTLIIMKCSQGKDICKQKQVKKKARMGLFNDQIRIV